MNNNTENTAMVPVIGLQMLFVAFGALVLVFGIGGMVLGIGNFKLGGIGLTAITGIVLNLILPDRE